MERDLHVVNITDSQGVYMKAKRGLATSKDVLLLSKKSSKIKEMLENILSDHNLIVKSDENKAKQYFIMKTPALVVLYSEDSEKTIPLLKELVNLNPAIPVIVITERSSEKSAIEAFRAGAWDYFPQPVNVREFYNVLSPLLGTPVQQEKRYFNSMIKAIKYINQHYTQQIKLTDVARIACMSVSTFERIFKKEIGVTFTTYVNRLRISKAINLLKRDMSMSEIAFACGFTNQSHFCRVFKSVTGLSPREYKKGM